MASSCGRARAAGWSHPRMEHGLWQLAKACGVNAAHSKLTSVAERDLLLVRRFGCESAEAGGLVLHHCNVVPLWARPCRWPIQGPQVNRPAAPSDGNPAQQPANAPGPAELGNLPKELIKAAQALRLRPTVLPPAPVSRANPRVSPIAAQPAANVQSQTYCRKINELQITIKSPWVIPYNVLRNHRLSL